MGSLIALDNRKEGFAQALKNLDTITRRTCDTCHVFYVKAGQKRHLDILENSVTFPPIFVNFLSNWRGYIFISISDVTNKRFAKFRRTVIFVRMACQSKPA